MRVPDVERRQLRELGHRLLVRLNRGPCRVAALGLAEAVVARRDGEARGHAHDVVLERARQGLVEVVEVEEQGALRRGERPEVRQVRVAAELNRQARPGRARQVGGHDLGRPAVEGERRHHHPPMPHRHEVGLTRRVLLLEQGERVRAARGRRPTRMARPRHLPPQTPCRGHDAPRRSGGRPARGSTSRLASRLRHPRPGRSSLGSFAVVTVLPQRSLRHQPRPRSTGRQPRISGRFPSWPRTRFGGRRRAPGPAG